MPELTTEQKIKVTAARQKLKASVMRLMAAELGDETHANYGDEIDLWEDEVDSAAVTLYYAVIPDTDEDA